MAKPTRLELRYKLLFKLVDLIGSTIHRLIPWGCLVLIFYFTRDMISSLAGKRTFADIGLAFLGDFRITEAIAWLLSAGGIAYGLKRRKLQEDNIERTANRIKELEKRLDPQRSSSHLFGEEPDRRIKLDD